MRFGGGIVGFAGLMEDGQWVYFGFRGTKAEKRQKQDWWCSALTNYMPPTMIGVSLDFLKRFISLRDCGDKTTEEVNFQMVRPASAKGGPTGESGCAYIDMLRGKDGGDLGLSTVFVSHAWRYRFTTLVQAIEAWEKDPKDTSGQRVGSKYWIDIFCKNQHDVVPSEVDKEFICSIESATCQYALRPQMLFVVDPWPDPVSLTRIWCLFELQTGLIHNSKIHFQMSLEAKTVFERECLNQTQLADMPMWSHPNYQGERFPAYGTWQHASRCVDVERAQATKREDIAMIMDSPSGIRQLPPVIDPNNPAFRGSALRGVARMNASLKFELEKALLGEYWERGATPAGGGVRVGRWAV